MLASSNRTLTVPESDPRVRALRDWLAEARSAAVALASGIEARFGEIVTRIRAYAEDQGKDWVACTLRRYSNLLERTAVDLARSRMSSRDAVHAWPRLHDSALLDTEHDGLAFLANRPGCDPEAVIAIARERMITLSGVQFTFEAYRPSDTALRTQLDAYFLEKGLEPMGDMQPARVPWGR